LKLDLTQTFKNLDGNDCTIINVIDQIQQFYNSAKLEIGKTKQDFWTDQELLNLIDKSAVEVVSKITLGKVVRLITERREQLSLVEDDQLSGIFFKLMDNRKMIDLEASELDLLSRQVKKITTIESAVRWQSEKIFKKAEQNKL